MNIHRFVTHSAAGLTNSSRLPFLSMTAIRRARNGVITFWTRFHKVCLRGQKETKKPRGKVSNGISESGGGCPEKMLTFACENVLILLFRRKTTTSKTPYTSLTRGLPVIPLFHSKHLCIHTFLPQKSPFSCKSPSLKSQERTKLPSESFQHGLGTNTANIQITQNCCLCCTVAICRLFLGTCRLQDIAAVLT